MSRIIDGLIAYRILKLLVTPWKKHKAYELGIIDDKGKVLIKARDFTKAFPSYSMRAARKAYTMLTRFVFNLKRLLAKVGVRGPLGTSAAAADPNGPRIPTFCNILFRLNTNLINKVYAFRWV